MKDGNNDCVVLDVGARYGFESRGILRTLPCSDVTEACRLLMVESQASGLVPDSLKRLPHQAVVFCFSAKRQEVDIKEGKVFHSRVADVDYVSGFRADFGPPRVRQKSD